MLLLRPRALPAPARPAWCDGALCAGRQGRKLSKKDAVPFKLRGMMQVMTQNGPLVIDKMAVDVRTRFLPAAPDAPRCRGGCTR